MQPYIVDKVVNPTNKRSYYGKSTERNWESDKKETADKVRSLMGVL